MSIQKAYKVWNYNSWQNFSDSPLANDSPTIYAYNSHIAKQKHLKDNPFDDYIDLRVKRYPDHDLINGVERLEIEHKQKEEARIAKNKAFVEACEDSCLFYIQRGFVGNSVLFWALGGRGYTTNIEDAQKYTKEEVMCNFVSGREEDIIWVASHVDSKIKKHVDAQYLDSEFSNI